MRALSIQFHQNRTKGILKKNDTHIDGYVSRNEITGVVLGRQSPSFEQRQLPIWPPLILL